MLLQHQSKPVNPVRARRAPGLLFTFILISLFLHGSSLFLSADNYTKVNEQRLGTSTISVLLTPAKQTAPEKLTRQETLPKPTEQANNQPPTPDPVLNSTSASASIAPMHNAIHRHRQSSTKTTNETLAIQRRIPLRQSSKEHTLDNQTKLQQQHKQRNYLLGKLQNKLSRYLTYPVRARQRGWQGEVMIAFHIDKLGQLDAVRLAKSSGYTLLDLSALSAFSKLKRINLPETLGRFQAMELELPVKYQLREG